MDIEPIVTPIQNKVVESELVTFDLEAFWDGHEVESFDLAPILFKGLILREKDFRQAMAGLDTSQYVGKHIAIHCSTNAVIPMWAFMAVAARLAPVAASVGYGSREELVRERISVRLGAHDWTQYADRNVIVKGCPSDIIPTAAYVDAVAALQKVADKIMYGEACSSVPIWKKPAAVAQHRKAVPIKLPPKT